MTDFTADEDKLHVAFGNQVWFERIDTDNDGRDDATVLYNAATNGRIFAVLEGFTGDLNQDDFLGNGVTVTEII